MKRNTDGLTAEKMEFVVFCIENVAEYLGRDTVEVYDLLTAGENVLYSYIIPCYDVLHTQGKDYVVEDIVDVMRKWGMPV